jgi:hypothetical protein
MPRRLLFVAVTERPDLGSGAGEGAHPTFQWKQHRCLTSRPTSTGRG